jgi:DNA polymerase-3 subunit alpha
MSERPFVHLHCHSHYSLLDGASRIPELVAHARSQGMTAIALTDHGNLYGSLEFYRECRSAGLNPVIGYEAYVAPTRRDDRSVKGRGGAAHHLTLLARDITGFKNLIKLSSIAFLEGYHYVPRIDKELLAAHSEGLICLSGCASAQFSDFILREQWDEAKALAAEFQRIFGEKNFFIEVQNNGLRIQRECYAGAVRVAEAMGLPLVATSDAHYLCRDDAGAHDVLLCINTKAKRSDVKRMRYGEEGGTTLVPEFYVRPPAEMYELFPDHPDAVRRTQEIADGVDIQIDFKKRNFPVFAPPTGLTADSYLRRLALEGLRERYGDPPPAAAVDRLEHELGIICRMGFASYFLIVWDFVRFAIEQGIPCSARGSGCGAVVSYVLKLSHVDPLEYDLLFERFLDPNRSEAPDIDIDFCQDRREEVIAYVKRKYGESSVAQIATFGTLAAKAALKDVGRVLDVPLERVNFMCKLVPARLGVTLDDALAEAPDFRREYDLDPQVREWVDIARKLEGTNRNAGTHAAGVVIANGPITDYVPVHRVVRRDDESGEKTGEVVVTTQWVMGDLEKAGMLKMDFLGLRTLTLLDNAVRLIKKTRGEAIDLYKLPLDDGESYALLQRGDAKGVFQFESEGIRELLKRMRPDNIRDIIACTALYRPGPLQGGLVDTYINCKHGREKPVYLHTVMEEILAETYGVMVYQEQVMRILNRLGGIELSSAYACIKAISKKKHDIIEARKVDFLRGAQERGLSKEQAKEIFEQIVVFGGYGFNKSHSAAYAIVSYQTAYLKAHYTPEFMAALLSSEIDDGNKRDILVDHIYDARRLGVPVLGPDVNEGEADFTVRDGRIVFGLTAIKGLGRGAAESIVAARREKGKIRDLFDFCERVDLRTVTRAATERLIKAGAFDCLGGNRNQLLQALPRAIQSAEEIQKDRRRGQRNIFDMMDGPADEAGAPAPGVLPDVPEWPPAERLKFEKEALDFYFSSHPLAQHEDDLRRFATHTAGSLKAVPDGSDVLLGGMLTQVRYFNTKRARNGNTRYVRCKLEDFSGQAECVMWPDDFLRYKDDFADDRIVFAKGLVEQKGAEPVVVLTRVFDIETARKEMTRGLVLTLAADQDVQVVDRLASLLRRAPGGCQVYLHVRDAAGRRARMKLGEDYRVDPRQLNVSELELLLGPGSVAFTAK